MACIIVKERSDGKKPVDPGDWISGIIEWIDELFKNRHIFISKKGFTSLYLGLYTFVLLYFICKIEPLTDVTYILAYGPILYFMSELIPKLHKLKYDLEQIKNGRKTHNEIGLIIENQSIKNPEGVINEVNILKKNKLFQEDIQISLLINYNKYPAKLKKYVDELVLSFSFSPKAICYFISLAKFQKDYLNKLIDKYGKQESFLFNLGRFQYYNFEGDVFKENYYNAGYAYKKSRYIEILFRLIGLIIFIPICLFVMDYYDIIFVDGYLNLNDQILFSVSSLFIYVIILDRIFKFFRKLFIKYKLNKNEIELKSQMFDEFICQID